ncbi:MAG: amidase [Mesorhizobium sp.]|nr:amidase [Mesorhizobium sp.]MBN9244041.1 amidase [Mesorhizobium sp.]
MSTDDISAFATAAGLGRALAAGATTAEAVTRRALDRIAAHDGALHSFVLTSPEAALDAARKSDERRRQGKAKGPLDGVPFAAKDLFHVAGQPTRAGSNALDGKPQAVTANAVTRLTDAGMVLVGKVQTVEFAFGSWGTNPIAGTPLNPRDPAVPRAPGGSSSGSGVAVAAGLVPAALGTDTGGSVRNPSAMCGVVGLKTTVGRVGRGGLLALATSFDSVGPLTRSVEDAALLFKALSGRDPDDPATFGVPSIQLDTLEQGVAGLHLRIPAPADLGSVDPAVLEHFRAALADLKALGAIIEERPMPSPPEAYMALTGELMAAEAWHNLGRYVAPEDSVVHPDIRARVLRGREVDAPRYQQLLEDRRAAQIAFARYLDGAVAFLTPTSPILPPPLTEIDETKTPLGTFTRFVNLMDAAALSVPMGLAGGGLPTGLQIVVPRFEEATALRIGRALERKRGGLFQTPAGYETP